MTASDGGPELVLAPPDGAARWDEARVILREYAASLGIDLCFQNFEAELSSLPGEYAPPAGQFLLALVDGHVAGCGGLRALGDVDYANACEMKRLFVRPAFRRFGLGRLIAEALLDEARRAGYSTMLLDTLDEMEAARGLYASLGFEEIPPYYFNPIPGAHYLKAELDAAPSQL
jgi:GNAT superfamily N-acetyltransferase